MKEQVRTKHARKSRKEEEARRERQAEQRKKQKDEYHWQEEEAQRSEERSQQMDAWAIHEEKDAEQSEREETQTKAERKEGVRLMAFWRRTQIRAKILILIEICGRNRSHVVQNNQRSSLQWNPSPRLSFNFPMMLFFLSPSLFSFPLILSCFLPFLGLFASTAL